MKDDNLINSFVTFKYFYLITKKVNILDQKSLKDGKYESKTK